MVDDNITPTMDNAQYVLTVVGLIFFSVDAVYLHCNTKKSY